MATAEQPLSAGERAWLPAALAALAGFATVGLLLVLWLGLEARNRGSVGLSSTQLRTAPDFQLTLFDGTHFQLSETLQSGKPVVLNFWASWCVPCAEEAAVLESAARRNASWATFVGANVQDVDGDARAFLARHRVSYPNGAGNADATSIAYGLRGVPETYFIAPDGRILRKWDGPLSTAGLDQFLDELRSASGAAGR